MIEQKNIYDGIKKIQVSKKEDENEWMKQEKKLEKTNRMKPNTDGNYLKIVR